MQSAAGTDSKCSGILVCPLFVASLQDVCACSQRRVSKVAFLFLDYSSLAMPLLVIDVLLELMMW
jgi:hypothetical protein